MVIVGRDAMRSRFEIVLADEDISPERLRAAGDEALAEVARVEQLLSAYRPDSLLYTLNERAADAPVLVSPPLFAFLQHAQKLSAQTDGAFDLTVGPLLRVWGLGGGADGGRIPEAAEIAEAKERVGMTNRVLLDAETRHIRFERPGVRLDPGAIGKGYALERAADILMEAGIRRALLHGGTSTVRALGGDWRVAIQHPTQPDSHAATVILHDNALSVSAVHGKSFRAAVRVFGHVIDPRTGSPVEKTLLAAVVSPSATETDALSTALLVLGSDGIPLLRGRFPAVTDWLLVEEAENEALPVLLHWGDSWTISPSAF
jgi:FAD:protein FMN transferase